MTYKFTIDNKSEKPLECDLKFNSNPNYMEIIISHQSPGAYDFETKIDTGLEADIQLKNYATGLRDALVGAQDKMKVLTSELEPVREDSDSNLRIRIYPAKLSIEDQKIPDEVFLEQVKNTVIHYTKASLPAPVLTIEGTVKTAPTTPGVAA